MTTANVREGPSHPSSSRCWSVTPSASNWITSAARRPYWRWSAAADGVCVPSGSLKLPEQPEIVDLWNARLKAREEPFFMPTIRCAKLRTFQVTEGASPRPAAPRRAFSFVETIVERRRLEAKKASK